jgi:hypothetical protein
MYFKRSGQVHESRKLYAQQILDKSTYVDDDGIGTEIEGFSDVLTELLLRKAKHSKSTHPLLGHIDDKNSSMDGFSSFFGVNTTRLDVNSAKIQRVGATAYNRCVVDNVILQKVVRETVLEHVERLAEQIPVERREVFPYLPDMLLRHEEESAVFAKAAHLNVSAGLMAIQDKHGYLVDLASELLATLPFMNGTDKAYKTFVYIASLKQLPVSNITHYYTERNNAVSGSNFSVGQFEHHRPPCQKPIPLPLIIRNALIIKETIIAANDNAISFSEAIKHLKAGVFGADALVCSRILRIASLSSIIVPNEYAIGAEIP